MLKLHNLGFFRIGHQKKSVNDNKNLVVVLDGGYWSTPIREHPIKNSYLDPASPIELKLKLKLKS